MTYDQLTEINQLIGQFSSGETDFTPEGLLDAFKNLLRFNKMEPKTILRRVEGLLIASNLLWEKLLEKGDLTRKEIITRAKLRPMSHYQYLTGSRTPARYLKSRSDFFNDPTTALVKLSDDIRGLAGLYHEISAEAVS